MQRSGTNRLRTDGHHEIGRRPSFAQERMWFLDRLEGGRSTAYVTTPMWWVRGPLEPAALERALSLLVARHETLRTRFTERDGAAWSLVAESADVTVDWRRATSVEQIDEEARVEAARPFDLSTGPLLKVVVWKLSETTHVLLAAVHHIVSDGWSTGVLVRELATLHEGAALPELPLTYSQYAEEQRQELDRGRLSEGLAYWRERLAGLPALELPTDRPRPVRAGWSGATYGFRLEPE
ncbi:condensation domain-containing protein, partial [Streptomyces collinus]|uniref:condensation domain-containing protein n=1 Tax=Streptomyces collinus TaxID=42684 RepID=UPI003683A28E